MERNDPVCHCGIRLELRVKAEEDRKLQQENREDIASRPKTEVVDERARSRSESEKLGCSASDMSQRMDEVPGWKASDR